VRLRRSDDADQLRLRAALNRYLRARGASRTGSAAGAELHAARLDLVQLLQDAGWEPPASLRDALREDAPHRQSA
jgi:hypothetical protein